MKSPKSPYIKAKNKAWVWFSRYIRIRDCLETTQFTDQGKCATCNLYFPFNELQAGHSVSGRGNAVLFDEEICHAQCKRCNIFRGGAYDDFSIFMIKKYGVDRWIKLQSKKYQTKEYSTDDLNKLADKYKHKFIKLGGII